MTKRKDDPKTGPKPVPIKGMVHDCTVRSEDGWEAMCCLWDGQRWLYWDDVLAPRGWEPVTDMNCIVTEWRMPLLVGPPGTTIGVIDALREERLRQIWGEGWTEAHDDEHFDGMMALAAAVYAMPPEHRQIANFIKEPKVPVLWPWDPAWWNPKDRRRDLIRAGALIIAEIERLDRAALLAKCKGV